MSDYFSSKLQALSVAGGNAKKQNIADAFEQKLQGLRDAAQARKQVEAQDKAIYENSIVGRLGLTPEQDPFLHGVVNEAVRLGSGASHTLGQIAAAGEEFLREGISTNSIPQEVRDARARQLQGKATADDIALLNAPSGFTKAPTYEHVTPSQFAKIHKDKGTNLSRIQEWEKNQDELAKTRAYHDVSGLVDRRGDRPAKEQLRAGASDALVDWESAKNNFDQGNYFSAAGDALKTAGKLANNTVEVAADNPMAAFGAVVENAPQLLAGALLGVPGTVLTAGSYAINEYQDAVADYRKKNNGAMPSKEWVAEQALKGGSLGAVEGVSDRFTLGMGKVLKAAGKTTDEAVEGLEAGFKKSLANATNKVAQSAVPRIAAGGAIGATGEYITEATQANIEGSMRGKDTSFEDTHMAGAMGAWAGGPIAAVGAIGAGPDKKVAESVEEQSQAVATANAVQAKDPGKLLNPKSSSYDPQAGLSALHKLSNAPEATPEEKASYYAQGTEAIKSLEAQLIALKGQTSKGVEEKQAQVEALKARLASLPESDTQTRERLAEVISLKEEDLAADIGKAVPPDLEARIKKTEQRLEAARGVYELLTEERAAEQVKDFEAKAELAQANTVIDRADPEAETKKTIAAASIKKLTVLSMASPDALSWQDAQALADNTSNVLTAPQRSYFTAYAESAKLIAELKTMKQVSKEVFEGDRVTGYRGLTEYRSLVGQALTVGNLENAEQLLNSMSKFLANHKAKNATFKQAWAEFNRTGDASRVIKDVAGNWHLASQGMKAKSQREYSIKADSGKLLETVRKEAYAIEQTYAALQAAVALASEVAPKTAQEQGQEQAQNQTSTDVQATSSAQQPVDVGTAPTQEDVNTTTQEAAPQAVEPTSAEPAPNAGASGATEANGVTGTPPVNIWFGSGQNSELSNLASRPFTYAGKKFFSVEHAYQSWKSGKFDAGTYNKYKGAGKKIVGNQGTKTKDGWNLDLMRSLVQASFDQNPAAAEQLLSTGNAQLTHTQDTGIWKNEFPRILMEVRESLVLQQELADTWEDSQDLADLRAKFPGSTFREATSEEQGIISDAYATMVMRLGDAFDMDSTVLVEEGGKHLGNFTFENGILTLNAKLFTQGIASVGITDPELATMIVMTHEQSHAMDRANGYPSQVSAQLREGGDIYEQAKAIVSDKAHPLYKWLKNPVFGRDSEPHGPDEIASELYAQSFTLYVYNKELMRETFPAAYQFVEATIGADATGAGSTAAEAVRTSTDTGANPAVAGQSEQAGSTSEGQDSQLSESDERVNENTIPPWDDAPSQEVTDVEENPLAESEPEVEEEGSATDAQLTVLAQAEEGSILAKWLKQSLSKVSGSAARPLTTVKDFMTAWSKAEKFPEDFLAEEDLSPEQGTALNFFYSTFFGNGKKIVGWSEQISRMLPLKINQDYNYKLVAQYLMHQNENGRWDFDENIKAAMVMAGITWVNDANGSYEADHDKTVNRALLRDEDHEVNDAERALIPYQSVRDSVLANSLGKTVVQALGLRATKEASLSFMPKLEAALGAYVLALLEQNNLVNRKAIPDKLLQEAQGNTQFRERTEHYFISLKKSDAVKNTVASLKGSKSVLEKLFGTEPRTILPTLQPVPFKIKRAKGSRTGVPRVLAKTLNKKNHEQNFVNEAMLAVYDGILGTDSEGLNDFLLMADAEQVDAHTHEHNKRSIEAKRDGLARELNGVRDFVQTLRDSAGGIKSAFYLQHMPWNQQRVGILNNVFNPQTSKIARYLTSRATWQSEVDPNNAEDMAEFKLRVLEGMGVKTDRQSNEDSLASELWKSKVENEVVKAAVDALVQAQAGTALNAEQRQAVLAAVQSGGEAMHTLHALSALAQLQAAKGDKFSVTLVGEVDGVTNGPMLSNLMLGAFGSVQAAFQFLNKGGFYEEGSRNTAYNLFRAKPGVKDLYETIASKILSSMKRDTWTPAFTKVADAVFSFTGDLGAMGVENGEVGKKGRNIVKRPITALHFGSSTFKAVDGMAEEFIAGIYSAIEAESRAGGENRVELIQRINTVIGDSRNYLNPKMSMEQLLKHEFTQWQVKGIKGTFDTVIGEKAKDVLNLEFSALISRRDSMTLASEVSFGLYNTAYRALEQGFVEYLSQQDAGVEVDNLGNLKWALTPAQNAALMGWLRKMEPILQTAMSLKDGPKSGLRNGLSMAKVGVGQSSDESYKAQIAIRNLDQSSGKANNTRSVSSTKDKFEAPGAAMFSKSIHSSDSYISHLAAMLSEALNIHDAHVFGFKGMEQAAQNLNGATWTAVLEYSPARESFEALSRTIVGLAELVQSKDLAPMLVPAIDAFVADTTDKWAKRSEKRERYYGFQGDTLDVLQQVLNDSLQTAYEADTIRLGVAAKTEVIDQYAFEGGGYLVSPEQRAEAQAKLDGLSREMPAEVIKAMKILTGVLTGKEQTAESQEVVSEVTLPDPAPTITELLDKNPWQIQRFIEVLAGLSDVPQSIRQSIDKVLDVLDQTETAFMQDALEAGFSALGVNAKAELLSFVDKVFNEGIPSALGNPFLIGQSQTESDPILVRALTKYPKISGKDILRDGGVLAYWYRNTNQTKKAPYFELMRKVVAKAIGDVEVVFVTPETMPADIMAQPDFASRGWFVHGGNTIYVLHPDFAGSGVDAELLLHELTHSALADRLDNPNSTKQKQAISEMKGLLAMAQKHVAQNFPNDVEMNNAVSNLHELVAYGMYNEKFQMQVLRNLSVPTPNGFKDGIKAFVLSALKLLGVDVKSDKDGYVDGLTSLMVNARIMYNAQATSQARQINKSVKQVLSMASPGQQVDNYTTQDVFNALSGAGLDVGFAAKLQARLQDIVNKVHGPFGALKTQVEQTMGTTALDVWTYLQATGQRPFAAKVLATGARFTQKEAYVAEQVEATVREAIENKAAANSVVYNELEKLWQQARSVLKGQIDADLYQAAFMPNKMVNGKSDYLSIFAALALSNQEFNQALGFATRRPELVFKGKTFMERLEMVWRAASDWVGAKMTGTFMGQQANTKLEKLVSTLVQIEARKRSEIRNSTTLLGALDTADRFGKSLAEKGKQKIDALTKSDMVRKSRFQLVRGVGAAANLTINDRMGSVGEMITKARNKTNALTAGEAMAMLEYVKGPAQWVNKLLLLTKQVEKNRLAIINDTSKAVLHAFKDRGEYLSKEQKHAITAVFLRTGLHVLEKTHGVMGIKEMLENPSVLAHNIEVVEARLKSYPQFEHYILQAKGLAYYRATERVTVFRQMMNAGNIARMFATGQPVPAHAAQAEKDIEQLVTLYALSYTEGKHKQHAIEVLRTEAQRGNENGVGMVLKMQAYLDQEARDKLFQGSEALRMHGFTSEILNPHVTFQVTKDEAEGEALLDAGYVRMPKQVMLDPADPEGGEAYMYVLNGGGLVRRQTGAFSYTGMGAKGEAKHNNFYSPAHAQGVTNMQSMMAIYNQHEKLGAAQTVGALSFDPSKASTKQNIMLPLVNAHGQVVDFRYVMNAKTKDTVLERNNNFEKILGTTAGAIYDKPATREQNRKVVEALRKHYLANAGKDPSGFITVSHNSPDARMREAWDLLPDATKKDIRQVWGMDGMRIPKTMADVMFGYSKKTISDMYDKVDPNALERIVMGEIKRGLKIYAKIKLNMSEERAERYSRRGQVSLRRAEAVWQEAVGMVKDFIVVKTGTVLWGNIMSNMSLLAMKGVPLVQGMKYQATALRGAMDYERDRSALAQLKAVAQAGYSPQDMDQIRAEMVRLEDSIARNPVKKLIDAGLMPTIVEDINMEDDPYSYKSHFTEWVDDKLSGVNPYVKTAGKWVLMTHDTPMYKFLSKSTQYSDFVARYALFMHLTQRKDNPLSDDDAVYEASETFVNYDVPLPKHVQYLDDMGLTPFIKYFFSIQRVLGKTFKDDPLRVLSVLAMGNFLGGIPMPTDSSFLTRIGNNPFAWGALELPSAISESMVIQSSMSLIK